MHNHDDVDLISTISLMLFGCTGAPESLSAIIEWSSENDGYDEKYEGWSTGVCVILIFN